VTPTLVVMVLSRMVGDGGSGSLPLPAVDDRSQIVGMGGSSRKSQRRCGGVMRLEHGVWGGVGYH